MSTLPLGEVTSPHVHLQLSRRWTTSQSSVAWLPWKELLWNQLKSNSRFLSHVKSHSHLFCHIYPCRMLFWTTRYPGSIQKAEMDGSSLVTIVTALGKSLGLTIDLVARRLYWTDDNDHKIQTSDIVVSWLFNVPETPTHGESPFRMTESISEATVTMATTGSKVVSRTDRTFKLCTPRTRTSHTVLLSPVGQPTNRESYCDRRNCTNLCVLSPASFHRLTWRTGWWRELWGLLEQPFLLWRKICVELKWSSPANLRAGL